ncbi:hypothetical protein [Foetidibacter luteolus]|uniref:hypothetical protein n=1 Tax=Foetidibacter luteolus TaxID=2608880 RepID=UPI00129A856B|nr:hypothetical protein [Foetidibacter luteolus]
MQIHFSHINQLITANVVYNFRQVSDVVIVMPVKKIAGLEEGILFYMQRKGLWQSAGMLCKEYPNTIQHLRQMLTPLFKEAEALFNPSRSLLIV